MKFKIVLNGHSEFTAFCLLIRVISSFFDTENKNDIEGLNDFCFLRSLDNLTLKLVQKSLNNQQFKKRITVQLDDCQAMAIHTALSKYDLQFGCYEQNLAYRIVEQLQQQYFNAVSLRYSLRDNKNNTYLLPSGGLMQLRL